MDSPLTFTDPRTGLTKLDADAFNDMVFAIECGSPVAKQQGRTLLQTASPDMFYRYWSELHELRMVLGLRKVRVQRHDKQVLPRDDDRACEAEWVGI